MIIRDQVQSDRRRGMISVVMLVALIIILIIGAALMRVALTRRAGLKSEERRLQAVWLADSGLDRASSRLVASADYAGETWEIPAEDLGGRGAATVLIRVETPADKPDLRKVHVQADYPIGSSLRSRASREIIVSIPSISR